MNNKATAWPEGVVARYLTVGGATVDVRHEYDDCAESVCSGCTETERSYGCTGLAYPSVEQTRHAALSTGRQWAQAHAEKCRAMPLPEAGTR